MSNPAIVMFSKPGCTYCTRAKALLRQRGLDYEERDIEASGAHRLEFAQYRHPTVPLIIIDGERVGGCDDLYALDAIGGL